MVKMPPKKARLEKNQHKISFFTKPTKDYAPTDEAIEVDEQNSHEEGNEATESKEQRKYQPRWASLYTWLTCDQEKNKMNCGKCISIGANNNMTISCDNSRL